MPISSISQVLLRIFALSWFLAGTIRAAAYIFTPSMMELASQMLLVAIIQLISGILAWVFAPVVSRFFVKGNDEQLNLQGVTERQLFSTAFVCIGLYFILNSFAEVFSWFHFFATSKDFEYSYTQTMEPSYYDLTESCLTLAAGVAVLLTAKNWAKKLTKSSQD